MKHLVASDVFDDLYLHTHRVVNNTKKELLIVGNQFKETRGLTLSELRLYIERDIFLAVRDDLLPYLSFSVDVEEGTHGYGGDLDVTIDYMNGQVLNHQFINETIKKNPTRVLEDDFFEQNHGNLFSELALRVQHKIAQMLAAYNCEEYRLIDGRVVFFSEHFDYCVRFDQHYLRNLLRSVPMIEENQQFFLDYIIPGVCA